MLPALIRRHFLPVSLCSTLAVVATLVVAAPALAQAVPSQQDLRALIYYLQHDDQAAAKAELGRLRGLFPDWTPPQDLSQLVAATGGPNVQEIYGRLAANDIDGAREALRTAQAQFPDWTPPLDLLQAFKLAESQQKFDSALTQRRADEAAALGAATPELMACDRINNPWRLAALQASLGDRAASLGILRGLVSTCTDFRLVVTSIEKARAVASDDDLIAVIGIARGRFTAQGPALDALQQRLTGRAIAPAPVAGGGAAATNTAPAAGTANNSSNAPAPATTPAKTPPAAAATLAAPTRQTGPAGELSVLARLPAQGDGRLASVRAAAKADQFADCAARSVNPRSLAVAYERAWCVYNLDRPLESLALFSAAANGRLGVLITRDARYGMALSYLKRNMPEEASRIAATTDLTPDQRHDVETNILDQRGVFAYRAHDYARAIAYFNAYEQLTGTLRRDLAVLRAYAYLSSGDATTARQLFLALNRELSTDETRAGLAAATN